MRQPNIGEILQEKYSAYNNSTRLKEKIHKIRGEGTDALDRLSNDVDLILLLRSSYLPYTKYQEGFNVPHYSLLKIFFIVKKEIYMTSLIW